MESTQRQLEESGTGLNAVRRRSRSDYSSPPTRGTTRPIFGILTQPVESEERMVTLQKDYSTYVPASFVRWLESGGARVVPIHYDLDEKELRHLFDSVNGIMLTGGELTDLEHSPYGRSVKLIFEWAKESCDKGDPFPIYGTCQGFQLLSQLAAGSFEVRESCTNCCGVSKRFEFTEKAKTSKLFSLLPPHLFNYLATRPSGEHLHHQCIPLSTVEEHEGMEEMYDVLAISHDIYGKAFVSCMEGKRYPFFLSQFHPERAAWEWNLDECIDHSPEAILAMHHLAVLLVNEARASSHRFVDVEEEERRLIYNTPPHLVDTRKDVGIYMQTYLWKHGEERS